MFKHNLRNSFCYYSGNIVIFSNLITVPNFLHCLRIMNRSCCNVVEGWD